MNPEKQNDHINTEELTQEEAMDQLCYALMQLAPGLGAIEVALIGAVRPAEALQVSQLVLDTLEQSGGDIPITAAKLGVTLGITLVVTGGILTKNAISKIITALNA